MNGWLSDYAFTLALAGVGVWILGLAVFAAGVRQRRGVLVPARWPTVPGIVRGSDVRPEGDHFETRVRYTYAVAGHVYQGHAVEGGPEAALSKNEAGLRSLRYATECGVDVHYDPANPGHAVLQSHAARAGVAAVAAGVVLVLTGALVLATGVLVS